MSTFTKHKGQLNVGELAPFSWIKLSLGWLHSCRANLRFTRFCGYNKKLN